MPKLIYNQIDVELRDSSLNRANTVKFLNSKTSAFPVSVPKGYRLLSNSPRSDSEGSVQEIRLISDSVTLYYLELVTRPISNVYTKDINATQVFVWRQLYGQHGDVLRGFPSKIFEHLLQSHRIIISDQIQSHDGKRFWLDRMSEAIHRDNLMVYYADLNQLDSGKVPIKKPIEDLNALLTYESEGWGSDPDKKDKVFVIERKDKETNLHNELKQKMQSEINTGVLSESVRNHDMKLPNAVQKTGLKCTVWLAMIPTLCHLERFIIMYLIEDRNKKINRPYAISDWQELFPSLSCSSISMSLKRVKTKSFLSFFDEYEFNEGRRTKKTTYFLNVEKLRQMSARFYEESMVKEGQLSEFVEVPRYFFEECRDFRYMWVAIVILAYKETFNLSYDYVANITGISVCIVRCVYRHARLTFWRQLPQKGSYLVCQTEQNLHEFFKLILKSENDHTNKRCKNLLVGKRVQVANC